MSLCCTNCRSPTTDGYCARCGCTTLYCGACRTVQVNGSTSCSTCSSVAVAVRPPGEPSAVAVVVPRPLQVPAVSEVYSDGRFGVTATVTMPSGDVEILNELARLAELLSAMATKTGSGLRGYTEHTRKIVRDMRVLAAEIQEEIEQRRGPL